MYYNNTEGNTEYDGMGNPHGFTHEPVAGLEDGYPAFFDLRLGRGRAAQLFTYLKDGQYLSTQRTKDLTAEMLVYNADALAMGLWRAVFSWGGDGLIRMEHSFRGVPAIDNSQFIKEMRFWQFVPDWISVLLALLYLLSTLVDIVRTLAAQRRMPVPDPDQGVPQMSARQIWRRQRRVKDSWRWELTPFWVAFEVINCVLMLAAVAVWFVYVYQLSPALPISITYNVNDADISTRARFFLLARDEKGWTNEKAATLQSVLATSQGSPTDDSISLAATAASAPLPGMPAPSQDYRYMLPADTRPLTDLVTTYASVETLHYYYITYFFLQGISLMMLVFRLINYVSFQPHLAAIGGTLTRAFDDLMHWAFTFMVVVVMFCVIVCTAFGYRVEPVMDMESALYSVFAFLVTGNRNSSKRATLTEVSPCR